MKTKILCIYTVIVMIVFLIIFGSSIEEWNLPIKRLFMAILLIPWYITLLIEFFKIMKEIKKTNKDIDNELKNF